ncbi:hypothetical protein ACOZ38_24985 [Sphaerisporangium viridialbum]|uniref:hypothetical protein n=1 Tax=Sphaerisporangium viridialbum TaxID=46189 RepID=UPI003C7276D3
MNGDPRREDARHSAGQTRTALRRLIRQAQVQPRKDWRQGDRVLEELYSARCIAAELDAMMDELIVAARGRDRPCSWARIGAALWTSGQAARRRARARRLPVARPSPEDYGRAVEEGRRLVARARGGRCAPGSLA